MTKGPVRAMTAGVPAAAIMAMSMSPAIAGDISDRMTVRDVERSVSAAINDPKGLGSIDFSGIDNIDVSSFSGGKYNPSGKAQVATKDLNGITSGLANNMAEEVSKLEAGKSPSRAAPEVSGETPRKMTINETGRLVSAAVDDPKGLGSMDFSGARNLDVSGFSEPGAISPDQADHIARIRKVARLGRVATDPEVFEGFQGGGIAEFARKYEIGSRDLMETIGPKNASDRDSRHGVPGISGLDLNVAENLSKESPVALARRVEKAASMGSFGEEWKKPGHLVDSLKGFDNPSTFIASQAGSLALMADARGEKTMARVMGTLSLAGISQSAMGRDMSR